jgi:hypothetical protein
MEHWRHWKPLRELTVAELRVLAISYRAMAATATTAFVKGALSRLADQYEAMANGREPHDRLGRW